MQRKLKTLIVAPHPDDEVLGAGGTLLRRKAEGASLSWLIGTSITVASGWSVEKVEQRSDEIKRITDVFGFDSVFELNFPTTQLDQVPVSELVSSISKVFKKFEPEEVFVPHPSDVHTDHRIMFDAVASCTKWFRYPSIERLMAYETLSETNFSLAASQHFQPNVYVNIEPYLKDKLLAMDVYKSELGEFPFPRSKHAISALAALRGSESGYFAAEAFQLFLERS